jgi:AraC-like DNA-binding protein
MVGTERDHLNDSLEQFFARKSHNGGLHALFGHNRRVDPLADVLEVLQVRGALMGNVRARAPWGLDLPPSPGAAFHAVTAGSCWVCLADQEVCQLFPGDVALLPTGSAHVVASAPDASAEPWDRLAKEEMLTVAGEIVLDGTGTPTEFICAAYDYDHEVAHPLLSLLPPVLFVSAGQGSTGESVQATLRLLQHELSARRSGAATIVDRLIDVLFVHVVRAWIDAQHDDRASWLQALRDPVVAKALARLHARPAAPWTLDALAGELNVSRSTLSRRFASLVGETPLAYLTRWRMDLAARQLRDTDEPVGVIAHRVGYASEYAFSRAFSRARGTPPGRYRSQVRVGARSSGARSAEGKGGGSPG